MKINLKAFENVKRGSYKECSDAWDKAVDELNPRSWETYGGEICGEWSVFSMYDSVEPGEGEDWDEDYVLYPDFESNPLVCEGNLEIEICDWTKASVTLTSPRINDVFRFFANNHDGHHGFLEAVNYEKNKLILHSGS